jgi:hypothetical protein
VSAEHRQDTKYFGELQRALDRGEREQLLHFLQAVDLEGWSPLEVPANRELAAQKLESLDDAQSFIIARLREGDWRERESVKALYEAYLRHCNQIGVRRPRSNIQLGRSLAKLFGGAYSTRPIKRSNVGSKSSSAGPSSERYAFLPPEETARKILSEKLGLVPKADGDEDDAVEEARDENLPF